MNEEWQLFTTSIHGSTKKAAPGTAMPDAGITPTTEGMSLLLKRSSVVGNSNVLKGGEEIKRQW